MFFYFFSGIGQMCKTEYNCHVEGSPSFCVEGYCSCPIEHHPSRDGKSCLKSLCKLIKFYLIIFLC